LYLTFLRNAIQQYGYNILLVEHKDRLARFGTNYLNVLLLRLEIKLEIVNLAENGKDELMQDLVAIVTSFAARLYGQRRASRKREKIIAELKDGGSECS
jgi:predicted site-specific integrase-resolvase